MEVFTSRSPTGLVLVEGVERVGDVVMFRTTRVDRGVRPVGKVGAGRMEIIADSDVTVWDGR